jgi:hypothetical protein
MLEQARTRLMQEAGTGSMPREVLNTRDVFLPRPQSASAASDRRMGLDPTVMQVRGAEWAHTGGGNALAFKQPT